MELVGISFVVAQFLVWWNCDTNVSVLFRSSRIKIITYYWLSTGEKKWNDHDKKNSIKRNTLMKYIQKYCVM